MRKLTLFLAVLALAVAGCSKHNSAGSSYYFTYTHGAIRYSSRINDSLFAISAGSSGGSWFGLASFRTQEMTDSAACQARFALFLDNYGGNARLHRGYI